MTHAPTRRRARRRAALAGGLTLAASLLPAQAALAAPTVAELTVTAPSTVDVGDEITVTVAVTDAFDVYALDLAVAYDPALVEYVEDSAVTPDGGFSDVADDDAGTVAVAHTRLGTSPGLEGDVTLATLTFTAVSDGEAAFGAPIVSLVGTDEETVQLDEAPVATTAIAAVDVPTDDPDPTDEPTGEPTDTGSTGPVAGGVDDDGTDGTSDPTSGATAGATSGGPLASTGVNAAMLAGGAVLLVAIGAGILAARRRAVASR